MTDKPVTASSSSSGLGLVTVITGLLLAAKLFTERWADLSWWWVFSPILIVWGVLFGVLLVLGLVYLVVASLDRR